KNDFLVLQEILKKVVVLPFSRQLLSILAQEWMTLFMRSLKELVIWNSTWTEAWQNAAYSHLLIFCVQGREKKSYSLPRINLKRCGCYVKRCGILMISLIVFYVA